MSRIFHLTERHHISDTSEIQRRVRVWESWKHLYLAGVVPVHYWAPFKRTALSVGDKKPLPFLKDAINKALCVASDGDILIITNDDNVIHPMAIDESRRHISLYPCGCARRTEFKNSHMPPLSVLPVNSATCGDQHIGRDLFVFEVGWLRQRMNDIPDFLLGAQLWDIWMMAWIRRQFGHPTTNDNWGYSFKGSELPEGIVWHQWHKSTWSNESRDGNEITLPSNLWNKALYDQWFANILAKT